MYRILVLLGVVLVSLSLAGTVPAPASAAIDAAVTATPPVHVEAAALPVDPLLNAVIGTSLLPAEKCSDYGQCIGVPNYTPCDTPAGCVCYDPPGPSPSSCGRP